MDASAALTAGTTTSTDVRSDATALVRVIGASKSFGATKALVDANLTVGHAEIHGLVGANGAGKSTVIRVLAGLQGLDSGRVAIDGQEWSSSTQARAAEHGLAFIHQELSLIPNFTVVQNLSLGVAKFHNHGLLRSKAAETRGNEVVERLGITFPLSTPVKELSVPDQWLVSIGRALMQDARLIVMDEATASLSAEEAARLFAIVRGLKRDGVSVLYVSHRLDEVVDLCDKVTIFKDGTDVTTIGRGDFGRSDLVRHIVGSDIVEDLNSPARHFDGEPVLEVRNLRRAPLVRDASFSVHAGEILGIAGLVGAGRTQTARMIFGDTSPDSGEMSFRGRPHRPRNTTQAVRSGIALVPEERRSQGLLVDRPIAFNINVVAPGRYRSPIGVLSAKSMKKAAQNAVARFGVKTNDVTLPVSSLSGGNQQKVVLAKWLGMKPELLILDEPTKGVDIGARHEIYQIVHEAADQGMAVVVISSDLTELVVCDRVVVMSEGRTVGEVIGDDITEAKLLQLCYTKEA